MSVNEVKLSDVDVKIDRSLDFRPTALSNGSYHLRRIEPNQQPAVQVTSTTETLFEFPNAVYNLYRSYLMYNFTVNAAGGNAHYLHNGFLPHIEQIVFSDVSGTQLINLNHIPVYTKVAWRAHTKKKDFLTYPVHTASAETQNDVKSSGHLFHKISKADRRLLSNGLGAPFTDAAFPDAAGTAATLNAASTHPASRRAHVYGNAVINHASGRQYEINEDELEGVAAYISRGADNSAISVSVILPLKLFYGTLMAVDRDLYYGQNMRLAITWSRAQTWGYVAAGVGIHNDVPPGEDPLDAALAPNQDLPQVATRITNMIPNAAAVTMTDCRVMLAVESDSVVEVAIKEAYASGKLSLIVPYVFSQKNATLGAGQLYAIQKRFNRGHGLSLLRHIVVPVNAAESDSRVAMNYNRRSLFVSSIQTSLNSKPLQDIIMQQDRREPYLFLKDALEESCYMSEYAYNAAWCWIDNFQNVKLSDAPEFDTSKGGISLDEEKDLTTTLTTGFRGCQTYSFSVVQKNLSLLPNLPAQLL
jgi:hypothetical protein